ncbi:MAG: thymidine phosphorylase [Pseudomonadota bacterium]
MDARAVIAALRRGEDVPADALAWFAQGLADCTVSDAQAGAFAMAVCLRGLGADGRAALTLAMQRSGKTLRWDVPGPVLDKHSTGGVGDCVSLVLAPALAACGAFVPMISGRGLGHTGGTLDKMESIPGLSTLVDEARFHQVVRDAGCAIVSASSDIAPADKRLYAVRDVTATVESTDLITASILSKKLAAGLQGLVLDVKLGTGAFMKSQADALELARALVETANLAGCPTTALITDMNAPLAPALGNALEVAEVMRVLKGEVKGPLFELSIALGAQLMTSSGHTPSVEVAAGRLARAIETGAAAERFGRMVAEMGGPLAFVDTPERFLPEAPVIREITATRSGVVTGFDGEALGLAVVALGGGRQVESDLVDPAVGLSEVVPVGTSLTIGQPLARVHAARESQADRAVQAVLAAIQIGEAAPAPQPLVREVIV